MKLMGKEGVKASQKPYTSELNVKKSKKKTCSNQTIKEKELYFSVKSF